jgi:hypothetical protein
MSGSNEFFYIDEKGKKQDAGMHDMADNKAANHKWAVISCAELFAEGGHDEEVLLSLYLVTRAEVLAYLAQLKEGNA